MGVAGQGNIGVVCVQKGRNGVHLYVFKASAYDLWRNGIEGPPVRVRLGFPLHRLPQREHHAAQQDEHDVAAQKDTRDGNRAAQQREKFAAELAALAFAQLLRQLFICHGYVLFFHMLLLILLRRSRRGFPLSDPADYPYRSARL